MSEIKKLGNVKGPKGDPGDTGPAGPAGKSVTKSTADFTVECEKDTFGNFVVNSDPLVTGQKYLEITLANAQQTATLVLLKPGTTTCVGILPCASKTGSGSVNHVAILSSPFHYCINASVPGIESITLVEKGTNWS